jgi:Holliday junction resolvase
VGKINSRTKGGVGERELAELFRSWGYTDARRGQQFKGSVDSPDVVAVPGVHFECKRTERFALYAAVDQARRDAGGRAMPVVAHRCNNDRRAGSCKGDWLFVLGPDDFRRLLQLAGFGPPITAEDLI